MWRYSGCRSVLTQWETLIFNKPLEKSELMSILELQIINGSNQVEAERKSFTAIYITFTQDTKDFQLPNNIFNQNLECVNDI
jgi:hypothetical protein